MTQVGSMVIDDAKMQKALKANAEGSAYTGAGDNFIELLNANSFVDEDKTGKRVNIKIDATNLTEDRVIRLNDILENPDGTMLLAESIAADWKVSASPRKYDVLSKYFSANPTRIRSIKFNVDAEDQLDEPLKYVTNSPWKSDVVEERIPSSYQSQNTNNTLMSEVNDIAGWQLSDLNTITYKVLAGRKLTLTITFGASLDTAHALEKKADDAEMTVARAIVRKNA